MRTKKFFLNSVSKALLQIIIMFVGIITPRIILITYGSEINGLLTSITQFISYFNLVEAGLAASTMYALYKPLAENDNDKINGILSATNKFYRQSGFVFVALTLLLALISPLFISATSLNNIDISFLVLILGINGALEFFTLAKYSALLSANQKTYVISFASMAHIVVNTLLTITLAFFRVNIVILKVVTLFSIFLRSFILLFYVKKKYKFIDYSVKPNKNALNKRWDALYIQLLNSIYSALPVLLITFYFKDLKIASVYAVFNMIILGLNGILDIFSTGVAASFGEIIIKNETNTLKNAYLDFEFLYYSMICIIFSITFIVIMPFIKIYTNGISDANYYQPILGFIFTLNGLMYNLKTPQYMLIVAAGEYKKSKYHVLFQGIIAITFSLLLCTRFQLVGIIIALFLSNIFRVFISVLFVSKNITCLSSLKSLSRLVKTLFYIFVIVLLSYNFSINSISILMWVKDAVVLAIFISLIYLILVVLFDRKHVKNIITRFKPMLFKNK